MDLICDGMVWYGGGSRGRCFDLLHGEEWCAGVGNAIAGCGSARKGEGVVDVAELGGWLSSGEWLRNVVEARPGRGGKKVRRKPWAEESTLSLHMLTPRQIGMRFDECDESDDGFLKDDDPDFAVH